jgi:3-hydroxy-9,10-secoandrosta-1,3,5(10)-triene-9,17-dione monooxygenase reductase component
VADGAPGRLLGLVDEESDFFDAVRRSRRFAVVPLADTDQQVADRFAGLMPAPGGPFATGEWIETGFGPVPAAAGTWAGCRLDSERACGWARLLEATIDTVRLDAAPAPLLHFRGRYQRLTI